MRRYGGGDGLVDLARFEGAIRQQGANNLYDAVGSAPALALDAFNRVQEMQQRKVAFAAQLAGQRLKNERLTRDMQNYDRELRLRMQMHSERLLNMQTERALNEERIKGETVRKDYMMRDFIGLPIPIYDEKGALVGGKRWGVGTGAFQSSYDPETIEEAKKTAEILQRRRGGDTQRVEPLRYMRGRTPGTADIYYPDGTVQTSSDPEDVRAAERAARGHAAERPSTLDALQKARETYAEAVGNLEEWKSGASKLRGPFTEEAEARLQKYRPLLEDLDKLIERMIRREAGR